MKSIDEFHFRRYIPGRYTCHNFADEVWSALTGNSLGALIVQAFDHKESGQWMRSAFVRLRQVQDPCIVHFIPHGRDEHHVGIYIRGRVLHLTQSGVKYQTTEAAKFGFRTLRFYGTKSQHNLRRQSV